MHNAQFFAKQSTKGDNSMHNFIIKPLTKFYYVTKFNYW